MKLRAKQRLFIKEYLVSKNAYRAALAAGYSEASAASIGSENLTKPEIMSEIEKGLQKQIKAAEERFAKKGVTKERWLREVARIAFSDMDDFVRITDSGRIALIPSNLRKKNRSKVIKKITDVVTENGGSQSLELHPKLPALEILGKHFGWIKEHHEISIEEFIESAERLIAGAAEKTKSDSSGPEEN